MTKEKPTCPCCKQSNVIKKGFRQTEFRGKVQRFFCKDCEKKFVVDDGFYRMRHNPKKVTKAINLYFSSLSSRKVRNNFKRHEELLISHNSVLTWSRKYAQLVFSFVDKLQPTELSKKCYADDTEVKVLGKTTHLWVTVDYGTKYLVGTHYSLKSGFAEAKEFINKSVRFEDPYFIQTDGAVFYPKVFRKLFYSNKLNGITKNGLRVEHRVQNARRTGFHNVQIETVFSKFKDRIKLFRGLKSLSSAPLLLSGILLQHNFIEEHDSTKKVPSELAGIDLEVGFNRWLSLIRRSVQCTHL